MHSDAPNQGAIREPPRVQRFHELTRDHGHDHVIGDVHQPFAAIAVCGFAVSRAQRLILGGERFEQPSITGAVITHA
jgi:hypothetical protein